MDLHPGVIQPCTPCPSSSPHPSHRPQPITVQKRRIVSLPFTACCQYYCHTFHHSCIITAHLMHLTKTNARDTHRQTSSTTQHPCMSGIMPVLMLHTDAVGISTSSTTTSFLFTTLFRPLPGTRQHAWCGSTVWPYPVVILTRAAVIRRHRELLLALMAPQLNALDKAITTNRSTHMCTKHSFQFRAQHLYQHFQSHTEHQAPHSEQCTPSDGPNQSITGTHTTPPIDTAIFRVHCGEKMHSNGVD